MTNSEGVPKFLGPKSVCKCGHTGDGKDSNHGSMGYWADGHGACHVPHCACVKFTWVGWTELFKRYIDRYGMKAVKKAQLSA